MADETDRAAYRAIKQRMKFFDEVNYGKRLVKIKEKLPNAFIKEGSNSIVMIMIYKKMFYWYPHKNKIRKKGSQEWIEVKPYTEIIPFIEMWNPKNNVEKLSSEQLIEKYLNS